MLQESGPGVRALLYVLTQVTVDAGVVGVAIFTLRVFRPTAWVARAARAAGALFLAFFAPTAYVERIARKAAASA
jgi:hypothetical protein